LVLPDKRLITLIF